jgi:hypothetical protein
MRDSYRVLTLSLLMTLPVRADDSARIDLNGTWVSHDYTCGDNKITEVVTINHLGDLVEAKKNVGDDCVPIGEVTWRGTYDANPFHGELHLGDDKGHMKWATAVVTVYDNKHIGVQEGDIELRFERESGLALKLPKEWKLATSTPPPDIPEPSPPQQGEASLPKIPTGADSDSQQPGSDNPGSQLPAASCGTSDVDQTKKGTWLTVTEMKDRAQDVAGIWTNSNPSPENGIESLEWFETTGSNLKIHGKLSNSSSYWVDLNIGGPNTWTGTGAPPQVDGSGYYTCPRPNGTCTNLCKWDAGNLQIEGLHASGRWAGKDDDPTTCRFTSTPDGGNYDFDRFAGVSFAPLACGRYMYMGMAPAVGPNPAQFKSLVRLATNYDRIPVATSVNTTVSPSTGILTWRAGDKQGLKSTYEFTAKEHGTYEISFDLVRSGGEVFHTDRVRIEIPAVPGMGN